MKALGSKGAEAQP